MATIDLLARTTTLGTLSRDCLTELSSIATQRILRRGDFLWQAKKIPQAMIIVQKSLVKVVRHTNGGRAICGLFDAGESVCDLSVVRGLPYPADAIAGSDTVTIVCIP